jgi:hypothetical protein
MTSRIARTPPPRSRPDNPRIGHPVVPPASRSSLRIDPRYSDFPNLEHVPGYVKLCDLVAAGKQPDVFDVMEALADVSRYCGSVECNGRCNKSEQDYDPESSR